MVFEGYLKGIHKSKGGIIRSFLKIEGSEIADITFSGDFFMFPEDAIDQIVEQLKGIPANEDSIQSAVEQAYKDREVQSPGTTPGDFTKSIMQALGGK